MENSSRVGDRLVQGDIHHEGRVSTSARAPRPEPATIELFPAMTSLASRGVNASSRGGASRPRLQWGSEMDAHRRPAGLHRRVRAHPLRASSDDDAPPRTLDVDERRAALVARANALRAKAIKVNLAALGVPSSQFFENPSWSTRSSTFILRVSRRPSPSHSVRSSACPETRARGTSSSRSTSDPPGSSISSSTAAPPPRSISPRFARCSANPPPTAPPSAAWVRWGRPCDRR